MTTENSKGAMALGSPMTFTDQPISGRENAKSSINVHHLMFQSFAERLYTREKANQIQTELKELEELLFCRMARELPEVYRQVSIEHYDAKRIANLGLGHGTHYDAIETTLTLASQLCESYKKYETKRNEINSFHQLVDGIEMEVDEAIRGG